MTRKHRFILAAAVILIATGSFVPLPMQAALDGSDEAFTKIEPLARAIGEDKEKEYEADTKPEPIDEYMVKPVYPDLAKKSGVAAKVFVTVLINEKGLVEKAEVEKIHLRTGTSEIYEATVEKDNMENQAVIEAFTKAAVDAIVQWRFKPAELKGKPVAVETLIPVHFRLQ